MAAGNRREGIAAANPVTRLSASRFGDRHRPGLFPETEQEILSGSKPAPGADPVESGEIPDRDSVARSDTSESVPRPDGD